MLTHLRITNFALLEELEMDLLHAGGSPSDPARLPLEEQVYSLREADLGVRSDS